MPSALSSLSSISVPLPSQGREKSRASPGEKPFALRRSLGRGGWCVMAAGRDSGPDHHLQRAAKLNPQQPQPQPPLFKRRVADSAPVGLWDRFPTAKTVQQMMETMERVMEDPFAYSGVVFPSLSGEESTVGSYRRGRTPWEIKEGEGVYKMRFDMPGMTKKDVKLWVEEKILAIKAEKVAKENKEGEEQDEEWSPKSYGRYNSRIALPDHVEPEKIRAEVKDGVLYITIPKISFSSKVLDIDVQ